MQRCHFASRVELCKVLHRAEALLRIRTTAPLSNRAASARAGSSSSWPCPPWPLADCQNLPIPVLTDANRHQYRDVLHFPAPATLQRFSHKSVQKHIRKVAYQRPLPPLIHLAVNLLVQRFRSLTAEADTPGPHKARVMSSTRRTLTPARYISISASSTEDSRLR